MKKLLISLITLLAGVSLFSVAVSAKTMYVRSARAYLLNAPAYKAKKVIQLKKGTTVEQMSKKGSFVQIKVNNQKGWMPKMVLSSRPLKKRVSLLSQKVDIASKARRRASRYSSTAAVRALTSGRKRISTMDMPDYEALRNIERIEIDEQEAIEFLLQ